MSAGERGHLSIGEVLGLLQSDYPDVTISKIRFLESQGLIDPERTPSGYRKFYDADIARLRWILTQQRDHFLPLKVIKDRLDEALALELPLDELSGPAGVEAEPALVAADASSGEATGGTSPLVAPAVSASPAGSSAVPDAAPSGRADPSDGAATPTTTRAPRFNAFTATPRVRSGNAAAAPDAAPDLTASTPGPGPDAPSDPLAAEAAAAETATPEAPIADAAQRPGPAPGAAGGGRVRRRGSGAAGPFADLSSVSFTVDELAAAVGMSVAEVEELERFGLITSRALSQGRRYGDEAVVVAKLAARFGSFGIEARHLRMFRVAVDRELALYEQVVAPLARQRGDGGEVRAAALWAELDQLGADLRDALFHRRPS